tara:strand:+ start:55 stop:372 length:318 start_codon:yes stop_codon:yes gene_type:complete
MAKKTSREKLNKLVAKREKLKARKAAGKKTILGKVRAKRIQKKINKNSAAQSDLAKSKVKKKKLDSVRESVWGPLRDRNVPKRPKKTPRMKPKMKATKRAIRRTR